MCRYLSVDCADFLPVDCADILLVDCAHFWHVTRSARRGRFAPAGLASRALQASVIAQKRAKAGVDPPW